MSTPMSELDTDKLNEIHKCLSRVSHALSELQQRENARLRAGSSDPLRSDRLDLIAKSIKTGRSATAASIHAAEVQVSAALAKASAMNTTIHHRIGHTRYHIFLHTKKKTHPGQAQRSSCYQPFDFDIASKRVTRYITASPKIFILTRYNNRCTI